MKNKKPLSEIAADLDIPWRVEWDPSSIPSPNRTYDESPNWQIIGNGNIIKMSGLKRSDAQFVVNAVHAAAGGYGRPKKPKYKRGDVVRVVAPFDDWHTFGGVRIRPRCFNWVGQRAVVADVQRFSYGIYLASEGPKSYCAWWEEERLEPYNRPSKGIAV